VLFWSPPRTCYVSAGSLRGSRRDRSSDILDEFCYESYFWVALCEIVVGTVEGVKVATKVKMDMKKPIMQLACHPRQPHLVTSIQCFL
jgi:hypothetical protein